MLMSWWLWPGRNLRCTVARAGRRYRVCGRLSRGGRSVRSYAAEACGRSSCRSVSPYSVKNTTVPRIIVHKLASLPCAHGGKSSSKAVMRKGTLRASRPGGRISGESRPREGHLGTATGRAQRRPHHTLGLPVRGNVPGQAGDIPGPPGIFPPETRNVPLTPLSVEVFVPSSRARISTAGGSSSCWPRIGHASGTHKSF